MPDIRYVCLSDMHLGEEDSLLTNLKAASHSAPSPVMEQLVECLRELISNNIDINKKPTLILNGDILEMALTTDNQAAMCFDRFIELIMPLGNELFEKIIFVPGNHDHHLWESARETQYVSYISKPENNPDALKLGKKLDPPWHATNIFVEDDPNPVTAYFLTKLIQRFPHLQNKDTRITTAYPNFGLISQDCKKSILFHHGHLIEPLYYMMSKLKTLIFPQSKMPKHVWEIEEENFAWIDFFWSTMGRSGQVGQDVEVIYEKMQDPDEFKKILSNFVDGLDKEYDLPGWDLATAKVLKFALNLSVDRISKSERSQTAHTLSKDAEKGLLTYMSEPLREQILNELKETRKIMDMPTDVTFVFGHTHKPFEQRRNFGYPAWVKVYNTGGWVVETVDPQPLHGGAVVLIDENLDASSLRMYNESNDLNKYSVRVEEAIHPGDKKNPFHERIQGLVNISQTPWIDFSTAVAREVSVRAQNLRTRINKRV